MELDSATSAAYVEHAYRQMRAIIDRLGDDLVNDRPVDAMTNSVAALVTHCAGVTEFWLGHVALGRASTRDRDAEFTSEAGTEWLRALVDTTAAQARDDIESLGEGLGRPHDARALLECGPSDSSVVLHVVEELFQHLGQIEITADVLIARATS